MYVILSCYSDHISNIGLLDIGFQSEEVEDNVLKTDEQQKNAVEKSISTIEHVVVATTSKQNPQIVNPSIKLNIDTTLAELQQALSNGALGALSMSNNALGALSNEILISDLVPH